MTTIAERQDFLIKVYDVLCRRFPRCHDCADDGPTCPQSGLPCHLKAAIQDVMTHLRADASSPSLTEEEIKKLMVTIPQKEFATASDDYMRGYQSGVNAHRNAVLALIRGERGG